MRQVTRKGLSVFLILGTLMSVMLFSGCNKIDELKVKVGLKNSDFEYIREGKVDKIVIQNIRDQGFKFVVTDQSAIKDLYDILSSGKKVSKKSLLQPDYIFEIDEGNNKVHKFNYIVGLDKKDLGNLYSNNQVFIISKRIDSDIINNFWNIRMPPNNFKQVYYGSIMSALNEYFQGEDKNKKIGINLNDDIDGARFILSTEVEEFKSNLNDKFKNASIGNNNKDKYDIWVTIKTEGYKSTLYKATVTFWDTKNESEKIYYIYDTYSGAGWNIKVYKNKPKNF
ncbi:MAG: hypothetical protein LKJ35_07375 [Clostridium luticellarii]|uniref:YhfM-like domain-containing protein n=2 Tax=Clostridium luticellarii TaxID=1691940 RepID=A0A2T0BE02_9CLOT|nr:hypothetical protein [Clostridium luticellarii]MCI1968406.1 hypothetical protein [Clostridium luticellarii]MCI2039467.1 hypothetical protein [Clostridium luticellarii]PRR82121.1 hypothetical protein CLLU_29350 [Clostridium luticellarii]